MRHLYLVAIVAATAVAITPTNGQRAVTPTECPVVDGREAVHIADPSNCHRFYKCDHGVGVSMPCPLSNDGRTRLCFNAELQVCDWPWNVSCCNGAEPSPPPPTLPPTLPTSSSTTISTPTTSSPTQTPPVVPGGPGSCPSYGFDRIPHANDCTMYYECLKGQRLGPYHCRQGLFFNPVVRVCDRPGNVPNCPPYSV